MIRVSRSTTLGIALAVLVPTYAGAQHRGGAPPPSGTFGTPYPSTLPPIRMGSLPPRIERSGPSFGFGFGQRSFNHVSCLDGRLRCIGGATAFGRGRAGFVDVTYLTQSAVAYQVPVYVPVPVWTSPYPRQPAAPAIPYDPAKSKMLTIGAGADGGAGVMRIEQVSDSVLRLTWLGSNRPIREARLFLADSAQRHLRSSLVDAVTPSALFQLAGIASRVAYTGLTVVFADGATQTTLVPYPARADSKP
jgi:hypothetical protein